MPKRFQVKTWEAFYKFISERDGEWCFHCLFWPARDGPNKEKGSLQIDHGDNDPTNWDPNNLHLLCEECNLKMRQHTVNKKLAILKADGDQNKRVTQEREKLSNTELLRKKVDCSGENVPASLKITSLCEVRYRNFCLRDIDKLGACTREYLIDSGAEEVGCSVDTTAKYLRKLTSLRGPLEAVKTESGSIITRRHLGEDHRKRG